MQIRTPALTALSLAGVFDLGAPPDDNLGSCEQCLLVRVEGGECLDLADMTLVP